MISLGLFVLAALAEIGGCWLVWLVVRNEASPWLLAPAFALLALFGWILAQTEPSYAGRAFAAYGGIYIVASLAWMRGVEHGVLDGWDVLGGALALAGAAVIVLAPRSI